MSSFLVRTCFLKSLPIENVLKHPKYIFSGHKTDSFVGLMGKRSLNSGMYMTKLVIYTASSFGCLFVLSQWTEEAAFMQRGPRVL